MSWCPAGRSIRSSNEALFEAARHGTFDDLVVAIWQTYTRPELLSRVRGFFPVVGLAAYSPQDFREFIDSLDDLTTMPASLAEREGLGAKEALTMATVTIAAIRGLLLQEILTPGSPPGGRGRPDPAHEQEPIRSTDIPRKDRPAVEP